MVSYIRDEKDLILLYLRYYGKIDPTDEFWEKFYEQGFIKTYYAIRKAAKEKKYTIEHITNLIGNVVKEGNDYMYKQGVNQSCL